MPFAPKEEIQFGPAINNIASFCGLDYQTPIHLKENLAETYEGFVGGVRSAVTALSSWSMEK